MGFIARIRVRPKLKNKNVALCLFALALLAGTIANGMNLPLNNFKSEVGQKERNHLEKEDTLVGLPKVSANLDDINKNYTGSGAPLDYDLDAEGSSVDARNVSITQQGLFGNISQDIISLPENSQVNDLNLTLTSLKKNDQITQVVNESLVYSPNYTIFYTFISKISQDNFTWVNITVNEDPQAPVGDINITVDGNFNKTFVGAGIHNHSINFTQTGVHNVSVNFYYANGTLFNNETFNVYRSDILDHADLALYSGPSTPINPYIRLNTDYKLLEDDLVAFNFSLAVAANLTTLEVYGKYDLYWEPETIYNISVMVCNESEYLGEYYPDTESPLAKIKYNGNEFGQQQTPSWLRMDFSKQNLRLYPEFDYYLVFNVSALESHGGLMYFDLATTNLEEDLSQGSMYYGEEAIGNDWKPMSPQKAALFRWVTDKYTSSDLSEININATLVNSTGGQVEKPFMQLTNSSYFSVEDGDSGPWAQNLNNLTITFSSNYTCQFEYEYTLNITQYLTSRPTNFTALFNVSNVQWQTWINATKPIDIGGDSVFNEETFNYTVHFPNSWSHFNGSAPNDNFTQSLTTPSLFINSSVSKLNWTFRASSPYRSAEFESVPENRLEFAPGMNITSRVTFDAQKYNASLSFWNVSLAKSGEPSFGFDINEANFLDYTQNVSRTANNESSSYTFPNFTVPYELEWNNVTAKLWWHNQTAAGFVLKTFDVKRFAQLNNYSHYKVVSRGSNVSLKYEYLDNESQSIPGAQISADWAAENWTYWYNNSGGYYELEVRINGTPGENQYFNVNFSHPAYIYQTHSVEISIMIGTTLELKSGLGQSEIYFNDTLSLSFAWYAEDGSRISKTQDDPYRTVAVTFDGIPINDIPGATQWSYDHEQTDPSVANFFVEVRTRYLPYDDYIGEHFVSVQLERENSTTTYSPQTYNFYFDIKEIPSRLSFYSSSVYDVSTSVSNFRYNRHLTEFVGYAQPLNIKIHYQYNNTFGADINDLISFNWGQVYATVRDTSTNDVIVPWTPMNCLYKNQEHAGIYNFSFSTVNLKDGVTYEVLISSNGTNLQESQIRFELNLLPKWSVSIEMENPPHRIENKRLIVSGQAYFSNSTDQWPASNLTFQVVVAFINASGQQTHTFIVTTDEEGRFYDNSLKIPNRDEYQSFNVSIKVSSAREHKADFTATMSPVDYDIVSRYVVPIVIVVLSLIIAVPLWIKYGAPFAKKKFRKSEMYKNLAENDRVQNFYTKITGKDLDSPKEVPQEGLDAIKTLRIPNLPENLNMLSSEQVQLDGEKFNVDEIDLEEKAEEEGIEISIINRLKRFNSRIKSIQEIFSPEKTTRHLKKNKNDSLLRAKLLEERGEKLMAIINYYFAQEYARRLELEDEVLLLENAMNRLLVEMDARDQLKFIKKYKLRAQKERES